MLKHCVVSIVTLSHLPYARVLMNSIALHNTDLDRCVFVVDGAGAASDLFRCITPEETGFPPFQQLLGRYTPSETCFAHKPFVLKWLIEEGYQTVQYLDSDICTYSSLAGLVSRLLEYPIVLTPHRLRRAPTLIEDLTLHLAGTYNGGYIGVSDSTVAREFLSWWADRTSALCYNQTELGLCGDQRWLDCVPVLFPTTHVERSPEANVGHWNLDERPINREEGRYVVRGRPLTFFHFSGLDPSQTRMISTHSDKEAQGELAQLIAEYVAALQSEGLKGVQKGTTNRLIRSLRRFQIKTRLRRKQR